MSSPPPADGNGAVSPAAWRDAVTAGRATLLEAAAAAGDCRACRLWERGTQTVFGSGDADARLVLVGEQPGDREDVAGAPFVGPAGQVLSRALDAAGIDRATAYLTNVVKHFSWEQRGTRRIHRTPRADEIRACRPWLDAEVAALRPDLVVCLGATATRALLGTSVRVTRVRGRVLRDPAGRLVLPTVHPSSILRERDARAREVAMRSFIADLACARQALHCPARMASAATSGRRA